jgi:hypothetical protein
MQVIIPSIHLTPPQVQSLSLRDGSLVIPFIDLNGKRIGIHLPSPQKQEVGSVTTRRTRMNIGDPQVDPPGNSTDCGTKLSCVNLNPKTNFCGRLAQNNFTGWRNQDYCEVNGEIDTQRCPNGYVTTCAGIQKANQCAPGYKCIGYLSGFGNVNQQLCVPESACILEYRNVCQRDWDQVLQEDNGTRGVQCAIGLIDDESECPPDLCVDSPESALYMSNYCSTLDNFFEGNLNGGESYCEIGIYDHWNGDPESIQRRKEMLQKIVYSFFQLYPIGTNYNSDPILSSKYQKIKRLLFSNEFKGYFDQVLNQSCSSFTEEDMARGGELPILCGCHLPSYTFFPGVNSTECQPVCRVEGVVGVWNGAGGWKTCNESNCIIDNINIQVANNSSVGQISFSQLCGEGSATCTFSNINLDVDEETLNHLNFTQNCGRCQAYDPKTKTVSPIPDCKVAEYYEEQGNIHTTTNSTSNSSIKNFYENHKVSFWIILISIIVIMIIVIVVVYFLFR